jgi:flagellar basal-body rod modification protein FlgD
VETRGWEALHAAGEAHPEASRRRREEVDVSDVTGVAATVSNPTVLATTKGMGSLTSEDFMKILITQLQQQDPMNPMSNEAMIQQISTIRNMEMNTALTDALQKMTGEQRFAGASGLIGKYVIGQVADAHGNQTTLQGVVTGVRFSSDGKAVLELDTGQSLPLEKLTEVRAEIPGATADEQDASSGSGTKAVRSARSILPASNLARALGNVATFGLQQRNGSTIGVTLG